MWRWFWKHCRRRRVTELGPCVIWLSVWTWCSRFRFHIWPSLSFLRDRVLVSLSWWQLWSGVIHGWHWRWYASVFSTIWWITSSSWKAPLLCILWRISHFPGVWNLWISHIHYDENKFKLSVWYQTIMTQTLSLKMKSSCFFPAISGCLQTTMFKMASDVLIESTNLTSLLKPQVTNSTTLLVISRCSDICLFFL